MQEDLITEKNYPIEKIWVLKSIAAWLLFLTLLSVVYSFGAYESGQGISNLIIYGAFIIGSFVMAILRRLTFHFQLDGKYFNLKQGIISRQERHIPYGVIQHVFLKQDLLDRVFGLASVAFENASMGAGSMENGGQSKFFGMKTGGQRRQNIETVGFSGNKVSIPGLKKENAEALKLIVLQKMKDNPVEDSQSGL